MNIEIDIGQFQEAANNPLLFILTVFLNGGWIFVLFFAFIALVIIAFQSFVASRQAIYMRGVRYVLLALDIPKGNEQTPKAVESIFAHLHGVQSAGNLIDRYWKGYVMPQLSFEIIGIEGQTQFLVRTPDNFRDVVEAAVYAQYPDAEITEVEDFAHMVPDDLEEAGYELWGAEILLVNKDVYPIKTYPFFEHSLSQSFLDPLASLLELMGRLLPTEQIWLQLIITPAEKNWKDAAGTEVQKRMGVSKEQARNLLSAVTGSVAGFAAETVQAALFTPSEGREEKKKEGKKFSELTSGEKNIIEAIQMKMSKITWATTFRMVYLGKKEFFSRSRGVTGIMGALKQFSSQDLNGFFPDPSTKTAVDYWFVQRRVRARKERILRNFKNRAFTQRPKPYVLNTEELASLFHFPVETVKAPQVQKTLAKRGEPPIALPIETEPEYEATATDAQPRGVPPSNLPG